MSTEGLDANSTHEWDYKCPQFCDFTATETEEDLKQMDDFFEVDHEITVHKIDDMFVSNTTTPKQVLSEDNDGLRYETPPQNKENIEDTEEVFYSTKKSFTVEKKLYKLRSTPMRTLQYNGGTPLRESRISSKKKKRFVVKSEVNEETVQKVNELIESLVLEDNDTNTFTECPTIEESVHEIEDQIPNKEVIEQTIAENEDKSKDENEVFISTENEKPLETEALDNIPVTGRESYVIEKKVQKTVQLVSPQHSAKHSVKKRFLNSLRRKGTPIRKSSIGANPRVSTQSIVSRLYSSAKRSESKYKSMAELLKEFETQPRSCDRSRSVDRTGSGQRSRSSSVSSLTRPQSPVLHAISRHRPTPRQTEDIIASQIKKYSFKANPIRKKLFDAKFASGIPRVRSHKEPTKAVELHFMTEKRNELRNVKQSAAEDQHKEDSKVPFKANPMPSFKNRPLLQTKSEKKNTSFRPFSFDERIKELVAKKRNKSEDLNSNRDLKQKSFKF